MYSIFQEEGLPSNSFHVNYITPKANIRQHKAIKGKLLWTNGHHRQRCKNNQRNIRFPYSTINKTGEPYGAFFGDTYTVQYLESHK